LIVVAYQCGYATPAMGWLGSACMSWGAVDQRVGPLG
jgi:hypothetical protein